MRDSKQMISKLCNLSENLNPKTNDITNIKNKTHIESDPVDSPIKEFYKDQTIFITGATGFLGTLLVEKLLRCCPQIRKLILLIRTRRSKSVEDRVQDYFNDEIFDRMRLENPSFADKVDIICGQLEADTFGLSPTEERLLTTHTSIIFHVAATVRFDEHIRTAYNINVKGTQTIISLAKKMPNLKSYVHVSTAYCNCDHNLIKEKFYPPTFTAEELSILIDYSSDEELSILKDHLIDKKPNTYTLTKATAEELVRKASRELPVCAFRPSIAFPTLHDPLPIWMKGFNGPLALVLANGIGLMSVFLNKHNMTLDIVPADRTIDAMTTLAWHHTTFQGQQKEAKVYNYVSCNENVVFLEDFLNYSADIFDNSEESNDKILWKRTGGITSNVTIYYFLLYSFHFIPGVFFAIVEKLTRRKPMILKLYRKMFFLVRTMAYFSLNDWQFENANTQAMVAAVTDADRKWCNPCMSDFRWETMFACIPRTVAKYLVNSPLTKEYYQSKGIYIVRAHNCLKFLFQAFVVYYVFHFTAYLLNLCF